MVEDSSWLWEAIEQERLADQNLGDRRYYAVEAAFVSIPLSVVLTFSVMVLGQFSLFWALPIYSAIGTVCLLGLTALALLEDRS
ncbi:hypothetical protein ACRARG_17380 [Pseudooceanicola sp. C21-150M6]|uniref:hypothetical protein n=1 Tax=Pseudooceanicola sp. C21-150M6 TaxID=3434355 RepID=UPI003D7F378E